MSKRVKKCENIRSDYSRSRKLGNNGSVNGIDLSDDFDIDCNQNLQVLSAYENICIGCGYGVFDAKGKVCKLCQFVDKSNSIYENICDKCGVIYNGLNGDGCSNCSQNNLKDSGKKKNIFHGLIGSLKRQRTTKQQTSLRKIDIVHNVDGLVYSTKETFNLDKICELRRQTHASDQHIYGKIRNIDAHRNSKSDPTLHKIGTIEERHFPSATLLPTRAINITDWMTSLRREVHEYEYLGAPESNVNIPSTKSIPSVHEVSLFCAPPGTASLSADTDTVLRRMIDNFKQSVMDKRSVSNTPNRRCGVYIKSDLDCDGHDIVGGSDSDTIRRRSPLPSPRTHSRVGALYQSSNRNGIYEKDSEFVNDLLTAFDAFLKGDAKCADSAVTSSDESNNENKINKVESSANAVLVSASNTSALTEVFVNPSPENIKNLITYFTLSSSLNRIVLSLDNHLKVFLRATSESNLSYAQLAKLYVKWRSKTNKERILKSRGITHNTTASSSMTVPTVTADTIKDRNSAQIKVADEEDIYQPIWKFKTVGEAREADSGDYNDEAEADESPAGIYYWADDHGEWEVDDEFMFSTKIKQQKDATYVNIMEMRKNFEKSDPYRSICILYSPLSPEIRAIVYDYDCKHYTSLLGAPAAGVGEGCDRLGVLVASVSLYQTPSRSGNNPKSARSESAFSNKMPPCVWSWRQSLWHAMEDEEDMYVSENEIFQLKHINEPLIETAPQPPQLTLQRFKSVSSDNLLDAPDDKKSIAENIRNKFSRGLLKLNVRPRENKINRLFKRAGATSLYLEDGMKPKYPMFGASLEEVEKHPLSPNVPRFVVDCVKYIEEKDCIEIDGLYRASGNKVAIDELKKKLSESYIYDPKLLRTDDVHTLTSLLKLFFRESRTPLIPPCYYKALPENLTASSNLSDIKRILLSIPDPSKSTLQFLLEHLTNVSHYSSENRMPASNLAIVWGPCILSANDLGPFDIARMNTLAKVLIENYDMIFGDNQRLIN